MLKSTFSIKLNIIYENDDLVVLDKPAGIIVHPLKLDQNDTLVNALIARYPEIENVGDDPLRPGIVHRLDKDTSGLIIVVKNNQIFEYFKKQFQNRKIEKRYLALVVGRIKDEKGIITKSISLSRKSHNKRSALLDSKSKKAITRYKVIKRFKDYTLIEAKPETGRTHQIRVHLASIGHPIAGDKQYKFKRRPCPKNLSRQFLHAYYLKFQLLNGKIIKLKSELSQDLEEVIRTLQ